MLGPRTISRLVRPSESPLKAVQEGAEQPSTRIVYATSTNPDPVVRDLGLGREMAQLELPVPWPAISGVIVETAKDVGDASGLGFAVARAVLDVYGSRWYLRDRGAPNDVGYVVAVNVSDVAAIGCSLRFVLAPGGVNDAELTSRCIEGVLQACEEFEVYPLDRDPTGLLGSLWAWPSSDR